MINYRSTPSGALLSPIWDGRGFYQAFGHLASAHDLERFLTGLFGQKRSQ
jgi:hypothetical protein